MRIKKRRKDDDFMKKEEIRKKVEALFEGEVLIPRKELWLIALSCLLFGIVYGLLKAPMTHGIKIASDNGNNNNGSTGDLTGTLDGNQEKKCDTKKGRHCCHNKQQ